MNKKILIVNEASDKDEALKTILQDVYSLIITEDALSTMDVLKNISSAISLIILNIKSQSENVAVLSEIKTIFSDIPVIMISSHHSKPIISIDGTQKPDDYILRPFKSHEVLKTVENSIKHNIGV